MQGLKWTRILLGVAVLAMPVVVSCGSGDASFTGTVISGPTTTHVVTLSWAPNRETGVNSAGGFYEVSISSNPVFTVPYTTTSATTILRTGRYSVTVRAHAALDSQGSTTGSGSFSAPSKPLVVNVP